jgi:hypothetical protein
MLKNSLRESWQKPFYAYVKNRTKNHQSVGPLKDARGNKVTGSREMAQLLNQTFGDAFTREDATEVPEPENGGGLNTVRATVRDVKLKIRIIFNFHSSGKLFLHLRLLNLK